jgi:glycosyltransferase involved in cell wall biosynthesis
MNSSVIFDFLSDPMGGLLTSARAFLNRARRFDPDSRLVVLEVNSAVSGSVEEPTRFDWINCERPGGLHGWRRAAWQNLQLPAIARRYRADTYVSLSHYLPLTLPTGVKSIIGISNLAPFSADAHAVEVEWRKRLRLRILRASILSAARRADKIIALSQACRNELTSNGVAGEKITVIPNGVTQPPATEQLLRQPAAAGDSPFILCVSHFYRYKNFERLVRAYALVPEHLRTRYRLVLVGAPYDPAYVASIRALVTSLGLDDRVELIPGVYGTALTALYQGCRLFVFPSLVENSPITLLEAMVHGAPVAASDIPTMRELGGEAAVYFDPHSAQSMAQVMVGLLSDDALCATLRSRGAERARLYDWDRFSESLVRLYQDSGASSHVR